MDHPASALTSSVATEPRRATDRLDVRSAESRERCYVGQVSVNLWGLDAIKTKGETVATVLELVGAEAVKARKQKPFFP